ncbi:MAG: L-serine ammonia-lyase, iron-sulfur-dependent subunit beta [Lachnospiraceae bacterium]|nr:L-serine ammonia-lyase, iron-sulfur-dependent subunit beta [Lachnospiraceae bacterium]
MNAFDIIGPVMIGPSSSHTAGACRIGNYARAVLNEEPMEATIQFSGSFKNTYKGHGTDRAIIGGLMGFKTDDVRIRDSIEIAKKEGRKYNILAEDIEMAHPNTALITMKKKDGSVVSVQGASIGGGNIMITKINSATVQIRGVFDAIIVGHNDVPGMIYKITEVLYNEKININGLSLYRTEKSGHAIVVIEVDDKVSDEIIHNLKSIDNVLEAIVLHAI